MKTNTKKQTGSGKAVKAYERQAAKAQERVPKKENPRRGKKARAKK